MKILDNFNTIYMSDIHQKNVIVYVGKIWINFLFVLRNTEHSHGHVKLEFITVNISRFTSLILYQISWTNERHLSALYLPYNYKWSASNTS